MSFSASWLDLREPADRAARDASLLAAAAEYLSAQEKPVVVDLGCGTGATCRAFESVRAEGMRWKLVDRDPLLLAEAGRRWPGAELCEADIGDVAQLPLAGARLVTASALLDLMPFVWTQALADALAAHHCGFYAALSYDGRIDWSPVLADDAAVRAAFNAHQRGDKGSGPALGPGAAEALVAALERRGYRVVIATSPWRLGAGQAELCGQLIDGIAEAAHEIGLAPARSWAQARRAARFSGSVLVGHVDVLALPPASRAQSKITSVPRP